MSSQAEGTFWNQGKYNKEDERRVQQELEEAERQKNYSKEEEKEVQEEKDEKK